MPKELATLLRRATVRAEVSVKHLFGAGSAGPGSRILRFPSHNLAMVNGLGLPWKELGQVLLVVIRAADEASRAGLDRVSVSASCGAVTAEIVNVSVGAPRANSDWGVALSMPLRPDVTISIEEATRLMTDITGWR